MDKVLFKSCRWHITHSLFHSHKIKTLRAAFSFLPSPPTFIFHFGPYTSLIRIVGFFFNKLNKSEHFQPGILAKLIVAIHNFFQLKSTEFRQQRKKQRIKYYLALLPCMKDRILRKKKGVKLSIFLYYVREATYLGDRNLCIFLFKSVYTGIRYVLMIRTWVKGVTAHDNCRREEHHHGFSIHCSTSD